MSTYPARSSRTATGGPRMSISSHAAWGLYCAWKLGLPLEIAGKAVFVPDEIGAALFPSMEQAAESEGATAEAATPETDWSAPHNRRQIARRCAWLMDLAGREITALGTGLDALATTAFSDGGAGVQHDLANGLRLSGSLLRELAAKPKHTPGDDYYHAIARRLIEHMKRAGVERVDATCQPISLGAAVRAVTGTAGRWPRSTRETKRE